jgi:hypothetical protein
VEPLLFLVCLVVVPPIIAAYRRYWAAVGERHDVFEAWCRRRPLVAAVFLPAGVTAGHVEAVAERLRGRFVNGEGCFPFSYYTLTFKAEKLSACVLGVRVARVRLRRGVRGFPPLLIRLVEAFEAITLPDTQRDNPPEAIWEEGWFHGTLYRGEDLESLDGGSWRFRPVETTERDPRGQPRIPVLRGYRELPFWLREQPPQPPRDGREVSQQAGPRSVFGGAGEALS